MNGIVHLITDLNYYIIHFKNNLIDYVHFINYEFTEETHFHYLTCVALVELHIQGLVHHFKEYHQHR